MIFGKMPSPQEFVTHHSALPYILSKNYSSFNLDKKKRVSSVIQPLTPGYLTHSYQIILDWKNKILEFEKDKIKKIKILNDEKNHNLIKRFIDETDFVDVNECIRYIEKLIATHQEYNNHLHKHSQLGEKNLPDPILSHSEFSALLNVIDYFTTMHKKLESDDKLIKKIVKNQARLKERESGELRREELTTDRQIEAALSNFKQEYEKNREKISSIIDSDLKKYNDNKKRKQNIFKEIVGIAAGPFVGPIAAKGAGFLASLLQTAVDSLNSPIGKRFIQMTMPDHDITQVIADAKDAADQEATDTICNMGGEQIAARLMDETLDVEVKLQPIKATESFAKLIDAITEAFYINIFSEEWLAEAAIVIRREIMAECSRDNIIMGKYELEQVIIEILEQRITEAVKKYETKLNELKNKIVSIKNGTPIISSATVISEIFSIAYTTVGIDAFKDTETFNHEIDDYFKKMKNRAGGDNLLDFVSKSEWYAAETNRVKGLGYMDSKAVNEELGIKNKLRIFAEKIRTATPGKSPKDKLISRNIDKRILTHIALVRLGEILKSCCGTILPELMSSENLAHVLLEVAKQGVSATQFKQFWSECHDSKKVLEQDQIDFTTQKIKSANEVIDVAEDKWFETCDEKDKQEAYLNYCSAVDKYKKTLFKPLTLNEVKQVIKENNSKITDLISHLKAAVKKSAKAAITAQEKTENLKVKLEAAEKKETHVKQDYQVAEIDKLKAIGKAWYEAEQTSKSTKAAHMQAYQDEKEARYLAERCAVEAMFRSSLCLRHIEGSWFFDVFHAIPRLSQAIQDPEVLSHLDHIITVEFAIKHGLADPAIQKFLNLNQLKGHTFCTLLTLRYESDCKNMELEQILSKIKDVKNFSSELTVPLTELENILISTDKDIKLSKNLFPLSHLLMMIVAGDLLNDVQKDMLALLVTQVIEWNSNRKHIVLGYEDKMSQHDIQAFYHFHSLLNDESSQNFSTHLNQVFLSCQSRDDLLTTLKEFFEGSSLLNYPELFEEMIMQKYYKLKIQENIGSGLRFE